MTLWTDADRLKLTSLFGIVFAATAIFTTVVYVPVALLMMLAGEPGLSVLGQDLGGDTSPGAVLLTLLLIPLMGAVEGLKTGFVVCTGLFLYRLFRGDIRGANEDLAEQEFDPARLWGGLRSHPPRRPKDASSR